MHTCSIVGNDFDVRCKIRNSFLPPPRAIELIDDVRQRFLILRIALQQLLVALDRRSRVVRMVFASVERNVIGAQELYACDHHQSKKEVGHFLE